jgi:hypothetical protein
MKLVCTVTLFVNLTSEPWNKHDSKIYKRATYVCANDDRYIGYPCVKEFTKHPERHYSVIYGKESK